MAPASHVWPSGLKRAIPPNAIAFQRSVRWHFQRTSERHQSTRRNLIFCMAGKALTGAINSGFAGRQTVTINFRSEEHTSELQSRGHLVCRLLLEKKKKEHQG